jgi:hypothetical protein
MIVAIVALFAALGGSAYAGSKIGFKELAKGTKNRTAGAGPLEYVSAQAIIPPSVVNGTTVAAYCPPDTYPIGGGIRVQSDPDMYVNDSHVINNGWAGTVFNNDTINRTALVNVVCAQSRAVNVVGPTSTTS